MQRIVEFDLLGMNTQSGGFHRSAALPFGFRTTSSCTACVALLMIVQNFSVCRKRPQVPVYHGFEPVRSGSRCLH